MRWKALIILLALGLTMVVPPSLPWLADVSDGSAIGTLDVCHSGVPALSVGGDMPCVNECPCNHMPLIAASVYIIPHVTLKPLFITFQDERPPQA